MLTGIVLRGARGLLGITQGQLSELSGVSTSAIRRIEEIDETGKIWGETYHKIEKVLTERGISFEHTATEATVILRWHTVPNGNENT